MMLASALAWPPFAGWSKLAHVSTSAGGHNQLASFTPARDLLRDFSAGSGTVGLSTSSASFVPSRAPAERPSLRMEPHARSSSSGEVETAGLRVDWATPDMASIHQQPVSIRGASALPPAVVPAAQSVAPSTDHRAGRIGDLDGAGPWTGGWGTPSARLEALADDRDSGPREGGRRMPLGAAPVADAAALRSWQPATAAGAGGGGAPRWELSSVPVLS